ncbi:MAG TPA: diphosphomevalonate decarboxylase [Polyangia bacterium]|nr:diphosphomevalonate decarboxylase [Polyangia bacterium]
MRAVAEARTNIALVKYWGKRDARLNLPAVGSLSLTLDGLSTRTEVRFDDSLTADELVLNGAAASGEPLRRVTKFLDLVREQSDRGERARVVSSNDFPTAAGLASSASAFAALALAATHAAGVALSPRELSVLARRGSGSAARSIFGGFVEMHRGSLEGGEDAFAEPLDGAQALDVRLVVAVTSDAAKETLSTDGMRQTMETSPYYAAWVQTSAGDIAEAKRAIAARDLELLGVVTERSCLAMHASAMASRPAVVYFTGATIEGYRAIQRLRKSGVPAWFTCDAGPHVKALTDGKHADEVAQRLAEVPGVLRARVCAPGAAAKVIES